MSVLVAAAACTIVDSDRFAAPGDGTRGENTPSTGIALRQVDGGADYYSRFTGSLPTDPAFFPLAVWSESVVDDTGWPVDKAVGLNTYLEPTANSDLKRIDEQGMHVLSSRADAGTSVEGYFTVDEPDLWAGPGDAAWTGRQPGQGEICTPAGAECGYSVMRSSSAAAPEGKLKVTNFGKGLVFWQSDGEAARFINDFQDVASVDVYWFTDPNVCSGTEGGGLVGDGELLGADRCRLAANYGRTVERVRSLVEPRGSMPVWNFVEVGHPFTEPDAPTITVPQIRAAVWSSLIAGARGITYFVHNFAGPCETQHALRDCGVELRDGITEINKEVTDLAAVLNAPFVDGLVTHYPTIAVSTKVYDGALYLLSGSAVARSQTATIDVGCTAESASVVGEERYVPIIGGVLTDEFIDGNAVHIYRIDNAGECLGS